MKLTFHDAPPTSEKGGRARNPLLIEFMETLQAHPGRWAQYPERGSAWMRGSLIKRGFEAVMRNTKGPAGDLWACWPADKVTSPKARPSDNGVDIVCDDCGWHTSPTHAADLERHCRIEHRRAAKRSERTPKAVA